MGVKKTLWLRRQATDPAPLSPWAAEGSAYCFTFQFLLIIESSDLHLKVLLYFIQHL